jgi:hypothetical protein
MDGRVKPTAVRLKNACTSTVYGLDSVSRESPESRQEADAIVAHQNIVLRQLLGHVPWKLFNTLVEHNQSDKWVKTLTTKAQLITLLFAQLKGCSGLRATIDAMNSRRRQLYHLGVRPVARSTLADANRDRPGAVYEQLFGHLVRLASRGLRRQLTALTLLIDSTSIRLNQYSADWAKFSRTVFGAKVHVIYDPDGDRPVYAAVTPANVNDITAAQDMPIEPGATYVFDLGYYWFDWWHRLDEAGCRIVTRLKKNTKLTVTRERQLEPGLPILSDRIGTLPARQMHSRRNPFEAEVREIRVRTDTGTILRIVTNDLDGPAREIADLYKRRWAIELFFRWIKQHLKIKKFMGTSENAIRTQVFAALIAFLLIRLACAAQSGLTSMVRFARVISENLMDRRLISEIAATANTRPPRRRKRVERPPDLAPEPVHMRLFGNVFGGVGGVEN